MREHERVLSGLSWPSGHRRHHHFRASSADPEPPAGTEVKPTFSITSRSISSSGRGGDRLNAPCWRPGGTRLQLGVRASWSSTEARDPVRVHAPGTSPSRTPARRPFRLPSAASSSDVFPAPGALIRLTTLIEARSKSSGWRGQSSRGLRPGALGDLGAVHGSSRSAPRFNLDRFHPEPLAAARASAVPHSGHRNDGRAGRVSSARATMLGCMQGAGSHSRARIDTGAGAGSARARGVRATRTVSRETYLEVEGERVGTTPAQGAAIRMFTTVTRSAGSVSLTVFTRSR